MLQISWKKCFIQKIFVKVQLINLRHFTLDGEHWLVAGNARLFKFSVDL